MYNGKKFELEISAESARGTAHSPVLLSMPIKPNQGILPAGLLLEESAAGLVPYTTGALAGVLDRDVDTVTQDSGLVIVHGSALREVLKFGAVTKNEPNETQIAALLALGVYPE